MIGYIVQVAGVRIGGRRFDADHRLARVSCRDVAAAEVIRQAVARTHGLRLIDEDQLPATPPPPADPVAAVLSELRQIDGLGPVRAQRLLQAHNITSLRDLHQRLSADDTRAGLMADEALKLQPHDLERWRRHAASLLAEDASPA